MRCNRGLHALFVLFSCCLCACSAGLTVLRPGADEQWDAATAQVVSWSKTPDVRTVDVLLVAERMLDGVLESRQQLVGAKSSYNSMTFLPRSVSLQMLRNDEKLSQFRWFVLLRSDAGDSIKSAPFMLTIDSSSSSRASIGTVLMRAILEKLALILCIVAALAVCCLACCWRSVRAYSYTVTEVIAGGKLHTLASAYPIHEADVTLKLATPRVLPTLDPLAEAEHGISSNSSSSSRAAAADPVHAIVLPDSARSKAAAKQRRFSRLITVPGDAQAASVSPSAWTVAMTCRAAVAGVFFGQVASPMSVDSEDLENGSLDNLYSSRHRHSH
jgi:hypothetical protein